MYDLTICVPTKNEEFVALTVADLLKNIRGNTEIVVVLDGWTIPVPQIPIDPRVRIITNTESKGQRAACNQAVRLSDAKYVAKCDGHCCFSEGFDVELLKAFERLGDHCVIAPKMLNLHAFDWICEKGHRRYQGPSGPCKEPGCGLPTTKEIVWIGKTNPTSTCYSFSSEPKFQYANEMKKRPWYQEQLERDGATDSMSLQGSFFCCTRELYWAYKICDESLYSWGSHGLSIACRFWLSSGSVKIVHSCHYSHMFRTNGDFTFPYKQNERKIQENKKVLRDFFFNNQWCHQTRPFSWLLDRFYPIAGWTDAEIEEARQKGKEFYAVKDSMNVGSTTTPKVGCLYYSDNQMDEPLGTKVRDQILKVIGDKPLVSVTLKPMEFGKNIAMEGEKGKLMLHRQILRGLEELQSMGVEIVYFLEHDVLYAPGYTDFVPPDPSIYWYNSNLFRVRESDGFAVSYDHKSLSQLCAYVSKLIPEYRERVRRITEEGFNKNGFEPGTRSIRRGGFSDDGSKTWRAKLPNIDIRRKNNENLSASKWRPEDFRSHRSCRNWVNSDVDHIGGWENLRGLIGIK